MSLHIYNKLKVFVSKPKNDGVPDLPSQAAQQGQTTSRMGLNHRRGCVADATAGNERIPERGMPHEHEISNHAPSLEFLCRTDSSLSYK